MVSLAPPPKKRAKTNDTTFHNNKTQKGTEPQKTKTPPWLAERNLAGLASLTSDTSSGALLGSQAKPCGAAGLPQPKKHRVAQSCCPSSDSTSCCSPSRSEGKAKKPSWPRTSPAFLPQRQNVQPSILQQPTQGLAASSCQPWLKGSVGTTLRIATSRSYKGTLY